MSLYRSARWAALGIALSVAGCGNLSGIGGSAEYGCKAPSGVRCQSVSVTYADAVKDGIAAPNALPAGQGTVPGMPLPAMAPLRTPPRILRMWVNAWEDSDRDLVDQFHVYVRIDDGQWQLPHVPRLAPQGLPAPAIVVGEQPVAAPAPAVVAAGTASGATTAAGTKDAP